MSLSLPSTPLLTGAVAALAALVIATAAFPESHAPDLPREVKARQAHMQLNAFNLGVVGAMAQGKAEYDAEAAAAAAANIHALATIDETAYWTAGTSTDDIMGTDALPAIWEDMAAFEEHQVQLRTAAEALQAEAGNGLEALQAVMGDVGKACGSCHEDYRQKDG